MTSHTLDGGTGTNLMLEEAFPQEYQDTHIYFCAYNGDDSFVTGFVRKDELREAVMNLAGGSPTGLDTGPLPEVLLDGDGDWGTKDGIVPDITGYIADRAYTVEEVEEGARFLLAVVAAKRKREAVLSSEEFQSMKRFIEAFEEVHLDIFEQGSEKLAHALVEAGFRPPVDEA